MEEQEKIFFELDKIPSKAVGDIVKIGNQWLFRIRKGKASVVGKFDFKCKHCGFEWFLSKIKEQHENHCPNPKCGKFIGFLQKEV